jgi:hypothetical protein
MKYFYERANAAHAAMVDSQKLYSTAMHEYLDIKQKKALSHRAEHEHIHQVALKLGGSIWSSAKPNHRNLAMREGGKLWF